MSVEQIEQEVSKLERDQFARDAEDGKFDAIFAEIDGELQRGALGR